MTVQQLPSSLLLTQQDALRFRRQTRPRPFGYRSKAFCILTDTSSWVMATLPELHFDQYLKSSASKLWG